MGEKTLGRVAQEAFNRADYKAGREGWWDAAADAVVAEHERRQRLPMSEFTKEAVEIIAGYEDRGLLPVHQL